MYTTQDRLEAIEQPSKHPAPQSNALARLYPIPETHYVRRQRAANHHIYAIPEPKPANPPTHQPGYWAREVEKFSAAGRQAWSDIEAIGRRLVRWLMWRVIVPLALMSTLWVAYAAPAESRM